MVLVRFNATLMSAQPGVEEDIRSLLKYARGYVQTISIKCTYVEVELLDSLCDGLRDSLQSLLGGQELSFTIQKTSRLLYTGFVILPPAVKEPEDRICSGESQPPRAEYSDPSLLSALRNSLVEKLHAERQKDNAALRRNSIEFIYVRYNGFREDLDGRPRLWEVNLREVNLCHATEYEIIQYLVTSKRYMQASEAVDTHVKWSWYDEKGDYWTTQLKNGHTYLLVKEDS